MQVTSSMNFCHRIKYSSMLVARNVLNVSCRFIRSRVKRPTASLDREPQCTALRSSWLRSVVMRARWYSAHRRACEAVRGVGGLRWPAPRVAKGGVGGVARACSPASRMRSPMSGSSAGWLSSHATPRSTMVAAAAASMSSPPPVSSSSSSEESQLQGRRDSVTTASAVAHARDACVPGTTPLAATLDATTEPPSTPAWTFAAGTRIPLASVPLWRSASGTLMFITVIVLARPSVPKLIWSVCDESPYTPLEIPVPVIEDATTLVGSVPVESWDSWIVPVKLLKETCGPKAP